MEEKEYITLEKLGASEYEDRKSVFLGFAKPVTADTEAVEFINKIKAEYPDARHHVYAYVLRENSGGRYTDDREPSGSAGLPVLDILRHGRIVDACMVVVRSFGGTLLGTGGLVKAYSTAAAEAVKAAGVIARRPCIQFSLRLSYGDYQKVNAVFTRTGAKEENTEFGADVTVLGSIAAEGMAELQVALRDMSAGRAQLQETGIGFFSVPLE